MKITAISDLHGFLPELPGGDLLLICGDFLPLKIQRSTSKSKKWIMNQWWEWTTTLPYDKIIFICGNHEVALEHHTLWLKELFGYNCKCTYLEDELYEYKGLKIYGTPWCNIFYNWAFMINEEGLIAKYSLIPEGLDILLTHDAPEQNEVGFIHNSPYVNGVVDASNKTLSYFVRERSPKYHFCGHIHSGNHEMNKVDDTYFANVSYVDESYNPTNSPLNITITDKELC